MNHNNMKKKKVTIIIPPVVCHNLDPHTGIPFMPHMAAYLASQLKQDGFSVQVLDSFGILSSEIVRVKDEFLLMGLSIEKLVSRVPSDTSVCFIYCRTVAELIAIELVISALKKHLPAIRILLFENIQAVTSFSIMEVAQELLNKDVDVIISGEPEDRAKLIVEKLTFYDGEGLENIPGIAFLKDNVYIQTQTAVLPEKLDALPFPAWELFDLQGYWDIHFAHAPVKKNEKFLPLLTSRGCPFSCNFCIAPALNHTWRARSAKNVVDEMAHFNRTMGITDFHISDLNPTVNDGRIREICRDIIKRGLCISWKLAQGTKIETIKDGETLKLMGAAGCRFISFSPETGSSKLLATMNKPFDYEHGLKMARLMHEANIRIQAVFLAGVPGETVEDQRLSLSYATKLLKAGVDEISLVVYAPLPGTNFSNLVKGYTHPSQCTPSPAWREDYTDLMKYRKKMYLNLLRVKIFYHPIELLKNALRILMKNFETKMEMSIYKKIKLLFMSRKAKVKKGVI